LMSTICFANVRDSFIDYPLIDEVEACSLYYHRAYCESKNFGRRFMPKGKRSYLDAFL
jgi:hypothetical protein